MKKPVRDTSETGMHCCGIIVSVLCLILVSVGVQVQATYCGQDLQTQCVARQFCELDPLTSSVQFLTNWNEGCLSTEVCCLRNKMLMPPDVVAQPNPTQWRQQYMNGQNGQNIGNGLDQAQQGEFPWMVALLLMGGVYKGAGSLIATDVVLTAGHVVLGLNERNLIARAGEWDLNSDTERQRHMDMGIKLIVRFPNFVKSTGANNLALLFLKEPFPLMDHISTINLAPENRRFDYNRCIVNGWGKKTPEVGFAHIMKKIEVPVVPDSICIQNLRQKLQHNSFKLPYGVICAGGEYGKDACEGDGGAPLVCPLMEDPTRYVQAGIVNFGFGCGEQNVPALYTDVASFRSWIDEQIQQHSVRGNQFPMNINYPGQPSLGVANNVVHLPPANNQGSLGGNQAPLPTWIDDGYHQLNKPGNGNNMNHVQPTGGNRFGVSVFNKGVQQEPDIIGSIGVNQNTLNNNGGQHRPGQQNSVINGGFTLQPNNIGGNMNIFTPISNAPDVSGNRVQPNNNFPTIPNFGGNPPEQILLGNAGFIQKPANNGNTPKNDPIEFVLTTTMVYQPRDLEIEIAN